jgi:hypothetical protein
MHRMNIILDDNALAKLENIQAEFYGLSKSAVIRMLLAKFHGEEPEVLLTHARLSAQRAANREEVEVLPEDAVEPLEEAFFHMLGVPTEPLQPQSKRPEDKPIAPPEPKREVPIAAKEKDVAEFDFTLPRIPEPRPTRSSWTRLR